MLFNSLQFAVFFVIVTTAFYALPHRYRWAWLLAASCLFYMAFVPVYIAILGVTIVVDYLAGLLLVRCGVTVAARRMVLIVSILTTCLVLFVFKYFNFASHNVAALCRLLGWNYHPAVLEFVLPIGLSFHTFQSLSYVVEVYTGRQAPERHFGIYALYVMFFPQLVAGPIERPQNLLGQFREEHRLDYESISDGLKLILWGLFKKSVIADRVAVLVNRVFASPDDFGGLSLTLAVFFFAIQIYCDFSGYSDMALGSAQVLGFRLMRNFRQPYFSSGIGEFWTRWHISLSTWFRDYVYVPLGGNRVSSHRWCANIFVTFLISGLWHGANWTYIAWGVFHGVLVLAERTLMDVWKRLSGGAFRGLSTAWMRACGIAVTFCLVSVGWVFFRAGSLPDAFHILRSAPVGLMQDLLHGRFDEITRLGMSTFDLVVAALAIGILIGVDAAQSRGNLRRRIAALPALCRWPVYYTATAITLFGGVFEDAQFIYFQF